MTADILLHIILFILINIQSCVAFTSFEHIHLIRFVPRNKPLLPAQSCSYLQFQSLHRQIGLFINILRLDARVQFFTILCTEVDAHQLHTLWLIGKPQPVPQVNPFLPTHFLSYVAIGKTIISHFYLLVLAIQYHLAILILDALLSFFVFNNLIAIGVNNHPLLVFMADDFHHFLITIHHQVHPTVVTIDLHTRLLQNVFQGSTSFKHALPISIHRWQSKPLVQSHVVQYHAVILPRSHSQSTPYHLHILRQ